METDLLVCSEAVLLHFFLLFGTDKLAGNLEIVPIKTNTLVYSDMFFLPICFTSMFVNIKNM